MPIYEYVCDGCRTVYQFFFRTARVSKKPDCPKCGRKRLERRLSAFAAPRSTSNPDAPGPDLPDMDDAKMERTMLKLEREMTGIDENDPRQMGRFMRRMMQETGMDLGGEMETAVRRLEAGEDPEKIEEDMGELLDMPGMDGDAAAGGDYAYDNNLYDG